MKMSNKKKIIIASGLGIVIVAIVIGVAIAVRHPGSEKQSGQKASVQTTESRDNDAELPVLPIGTEDPQAETDASVTQSERVTDGKTDSNDAKASDKKSTSEPDSKENPDQRISHSTDQKSSDSNVDTTGQEDQTDQENRDQRSEDNGKDSGTRSDQTTDNNKSQEDQKDNGSDRSDSGKKSSDVIELPFVPADEG